MASSINIPLTGEVAACKTVEMKDGSKLVRLVLVADDGELYEFWAVLTTLIQAYNRIPERGERIGAIVRVRVRTNTDELKFTFVDALPLDAAPATAPAASLDPLDHL